MFRILAKGLKMSWTLIFAIAALVFLNRYLFLEPRVDIRLPYFVRRMLHYSAPCLLTAMCIPVIFFDTTQQLRPILSNIYGYAALATIAFYLCSRRILFSSVFGFIVFYVLYYWI